MGSRGEITDGQGPFLTVDPYQAPFAASVRPEAAPFPVLGCCYKTALHGIAMHVPKLLDAFLRTGDVEIVKPLLPDRPRTGPPWGSSLVKRSLTTLITTEGSPTSGSVMTKMEMLGHHHVPDHDKTMPLPGAFQRSEERRVGKEGR